MKTTAVFVAAAIALSSVAWSEGARAQAAQQPPAALKKPRPFDAVTGIVFTCAMATGHAWTGEACNRLSAEFKKRAEALKLPFVEVVITATFSREKRATVNGFDQDKAVRVFWNFKETGAEKRIQGGISANRIWEPTAKEIPNVAPGQRIPLNFYAQSAIFTPGTGLSTAEPVLKQFTDTFFELGEGKI